jgi:hypothetical protein
MDLKLPKWLVRLKGERLDLQDLPKLFCSSEIRVVEENGLFYLESTEFNSLSSVEDVHKRGKELIQLINRVVKFLRDNFQDISEDGIIKVEDNSKRSNYIFLQATITVRSNFWAQAKVISADGAEKVDTQPNIFESLLQKTQKYPDVADALKFYKKGSWVSLYKVLEIIEDNVGGIDQIIKNGWTTKNKIRRFKHTAQSKDIIGDDARHASKKIKSPDKTMTLSEAKPFIKSILSRWIDSKN